MNTQAESSSSRNSFGKSAALLLGAGVLVVAGFAWQANRTSDLAKQIAENNQQKAALQAKLEQSDSAWQSAMKSVQQELDETRTQNKSLVTESDRMSRRRADAFAKQQTAQNQQWAQEL